MTAFRFRHDASDEKYEMVYVFGNHVLFTDNRIDRSTVPSDLYLYEVSYDDDNIGNPDCISNRIIADFLGSILSPVNLGNLKEYLFLACYSDWKWTGEFTDLASITGE